MANQDVVFPPDMGGIGAARALFACRGAASTLRSAHLGRQGLIPGTVDDEYRAPRPSTSSSWVVEAIRASSPARSPAVEEHAAWTRRHPSALGSFDQQIASAAEGKQVVVFMDYDGTLAPIVADPDMAFMSNEMREAVRDVTKHFPAAIVTGRSVDKVHSFVGLSELYYAGSHGMDIKGPTSKDTTAAAVLLLQPAREFLPVIAEAYEALVEKTKGTPGARVENNKFCLSVHFRCVDENRWSPLAEQVKAVLRDYPDLKLTEGRKVLEIRPSIMWDKGKAVEFLLQTLGFDGRSDVLPVYLGDDRTDEDAFKVLGKRDHGVGILVSKCPRETNASYSLQDPTEVLEFLLRLVQWKCRPSSSAMCARV
ncbi:probable trehalose-phosphate phosphatase 8 [Brachypodium distachyon]|uniref:Trehalose 6-phosphate phosphatase n=1 Tax=Brachypodium distachyon TaxID=15368 RepID=I1GZN3_BRADI|nr:probable trehalose-phosphate phosphatase 8 [Brachypodium distachyon]KQK18917.1 hypothetical protein BRADI_1g45480v3 [Brachypodium distachyon]|eukprot:XP_024313767.1 probable trehalose-phosphate phosphatase 8 [Brachypodium distachyon]